MYQVAKKYSKDRPVTPSLPDDKHRRMARNALYDLFDFYEALEREITRFQAAEQKNTIEQEILSRLLHARDCYQQAMCDLRDAADDKKQHALIRFSDALLDVMKAIHRQKAL